MPAEVLPGFDFGNCRRNAQLAAQGMAAPRATKTGTTIVGIMFKDGVILGADTRATEGPIVSDKNCAKIHHIAERMYCCGAGTAADTEMTTKMIASQMELLKLHMDRPGRVTTASTRLKRLLFRYQGHIGAALVLGGVDSTGPHIYSIAPHGSTDRLPYATMGSGSLAAMAVFESRWKKDMSKEEGMKLVRDAIAAGIFNDLGSGSNIDLCIITHGEVKHLRGYEIANKRGVRQGTYNYKKGATAVLSTQSNPVIITQLQVRGIETVHEPMYT